MNARRTWAVLMLTGLSTVACEEGRRDAPSDSPGAAPSTTAPEPEQPGPATAAPTRAPLPTEPVELPRPPQAAEHCDDRGLEAPDPGPALIRRLTRTEYDNTVRDLLGDATGPARAFLPDEESIGFRNQAESLQISALHVEQYMQAAEALAENAMLRIEALLPCAPAAVGEIECLRSFVERFGRRAWRRPLEVDEVDRLVTLYDAASEMEPPRFERAVRLVIQALLQSPNFLFRIEVGEPFTVLEPGRAAREDTERLKLTDFEVASRLSYLLWQSMPDEALLSAAEQGRLGTREEVAAQARRLMADQRARPALLDFFNQWLRVDEVLEIDRDPEWYPDFDPAIRPLLAEETHTFLEALLWGDDRDLKALFAAEHTWLNEALARFYGIEGVEGEQMRRVAVDPSQRTGVLTQGAIMAVTSKSNMTSPIFRGQYVRERVLCTPLPPPPPNIPIVPPDPDPNSSTREKFSQHSADPACASCHSLIDPIGFGFENFDALGRWRTEENGHPVDASGALTATLDADGAFVGAAQLSRKLAESEQVQRCVVTQVFRFAHGRGETTEDLCGIDSLYAAYEQGGRDFLSLVEHLTTTDAFRFRRRPPVETTEGTP